MKLLPLAAIVCVLGAACAAPPPAPPKTQLQIRQFQTRVYDTRDARLVLKAVMNVLQDENFMVKNASAELGFVTATRELDISGDVTDKLMQVLLQGPYKPLRRNSIEDCTVNVSEFGDQVRVRANFQVKRIDNQGSVMDVANVEDGEFYQDFFSKLDKGIFILKEKL